MGIIALRKDLPPGATFFKQEGRGVYYSFDRVNWILGWILPASGGGGGTTWGNTVIKAEKWEYYIRKYSQNHYQNNTFINIVNNFEIPENRGDAKNGMEDLQESVFTQRKLCGAIYEFLYTMRELGIAVSNGSLEPDDVERAGEFISAIPLVGPLAKVGLQVAIGVAGYVLPGVAAAVVAQWSDEQLEEYVCCIYDELKDGNFTYSEFANLGNVCSIGAWDEIISPERYAFFLAILKHGGETSQPCPCEECVTYYPTDHEILRGEAVETSLMTVSTNVSGSLFEMQANVKFTIPMQTITKITVYYLIKPYENLATSAPRIEFSAPGTGGVHLTNLVQDATLKIDIPTNALPLVPVDNFTIRLITSTCSACSTAQRALFDESWGGILSVVVCGIQ